MGAPDAVRLAPVARTLGLGPKILAVRRRRAACHRTEHASPRIAPRRSRDAVLRRLLGLIEESNGAQHLTLDGWLDAAAIPALLAAINQAPAADVTIDIDRLESIDGAKWLRRIARAT
jgi:hypothetical protein